MRIPSYTGQFKRDVKLAQKRGKDMGKLKSIIELLLNNQALPREFGFKTPNEVFMQSLNRVALRV
jgi:mRNA interferase YafQ